LIENGDRSLVLYPMKAVTRRTERRPAFIEEIKNIGNFDRLIDLSVKENSGKFLEGTGSRLTLVI
jgi:hypothetical protein